jgi:hypothetical protein
MFDRPEQTCKICRRNSLRDYWFRVIGWVHGGRR